MAVSYAIAWCGSRNPDYYDYTNSGGDCANFVSQCLAAGGLSPEDHDSADGYGSIISCRQLHDYLANDLDIRFETKSESEDVPPWISVGDVAILSTGSTPKHAVFAVSGGATSKTMYAAHSADICAQLASYFFANSAWDSCTYYDVAPLSTANKQIDMNIVLQALAILLAAIVLASSSSLLPQ